jgi:hypothetical protein
MNKEKVLSLAAIIVVVWVVGFISGVVTTNNLHLTSRTMIGFSVTTTVTELNTVTGLTYNGTPFLTLRLSTISQTTLKVENFTYRGAIITIAYSPSSPSIFGIAYVQGPPYTAIRVDITNCLLTTNNPLATAAGTVTVEWLLYPNTYLGSGGNFVPTRNSVAYFYLTGGENLGMELRTVGYTG